MKKTGVEPRSSRPEADRRGRAPRLDDQLCFALHSVSRALTSAYRPVLKKLDLTYPQYLVVLVLWERDHVPISEIGTRLHLDSSTLTPLLKRLEDRGLLVRTRDRTDERKVFVSLTEKGLHLRDDADGIVDAISCIIGLPTAEARALRGQLQQMRERIEAHERAANGGLADCG